MIQNVSLEAEVRTDRGKNAARRFRREGRIPGVIYGSGGESLAVAVDPRKIEDILRLETGRNTIFSLGVRGAETAGAVMIKELQRDPLAGALLHIDLVRVDLNREVTVNVPVRLHGTPEGVKTDGGLLEFVLREVEVECLPTDIPEHIDVDVTGLRLNQHVTVADLPRTEKFKILDDPEASVVAIMPPKAEAAPVEAEAAETAAAEPEVIKKGREAAPEEAAPAEKKGPKEREK